MDDIDWNLIKSFVTVAETGSLSAAARKLSASQPTLGRHIGELDKRSISRCSGVGGAAMN